MEDIRKKYNPLVDLLKFIYTKNMSSKVVVTNYNLLCSKTFSIFNGQSLVTNLIVAQNYNFHEKKLTWLPILKI